MNPDSYTALYGPGRPAPAPRRGQAGVAVLAGLVWAVVLVLLSYPAMLVFLAVFFGAATGVPVGDVVLWSTLVGLGAFGAPVALTFLPPVRRLPVPTRFLLAGGVALPLVSGILVWMASQGG
ncbi:hypothetical protein ACIRTB_06730 [Streptomyces sp. NPDC101158]|uniref:hypothetical protein n=1 Tax=Streptomyces sp. NPDC101158 TaxID=3366117 RepID=UPI003829A2D4